MSAPENCIDCEHHRVVADPDPDDWFCDDDVAVLCTKSGGAADSRFPNRAVTTSCRPYRTRAECPAPAWCPLRAPTQVK